MRVPAPKGFVLEDNVCVETCRTTTLTSRAGDTITIPRYKYIGEAKNLAEGTSGKPIKLETEEVAYKVKKAAQFVSLTDEAVLSGYGDPVGEVAKQLQMNIENKIDSDALVIIESLGTNRTISGTKTIDFDLICEAVDLFDNDEANESMTLLVSSKCLSELRKDSRFNDGGALSDQLTQSGTVGAIVGCKVAKWKKLPDDTACTI